MARVIACVKIVAAWTIVAPAVAGAAVGSNVLVEPYCDNSIRIRIASESQVVLHNQLGALEESAPCSSTTAVFRSSSAGGLGATTTTTTNGNLQVTLDDGANFISITRVSKTARLEGMVPALFALRSGRPFFATRAFAAFASHASITCLQAASCLRIF